MKLLNKIYNRIKIELFFIRRLISESYGPRYWRPYIKNRFFGNFLISRLPKYEYIADPDIELHTICGKRDLWMLVWMLRSFLLLSKLRPVIVIHDDGSFDKKTAGLIQSKFSNIKILFRSEAAKLTLAMPDLPNIVRQARIQGHFFLDRLIDILTLSKASKIIVSDTDILFLKSPTEVIDFITGKTNLDALCQGQNYKPFDLKMDDYYTQKYNLQTNRIAFMNGGYILVDRKKINLAQLAEYLEHVRRPFNDYFIEMSGWACILAKLNYEFLPFERYHSKGPVTDKTVFKHFTSPRRYEMFAYGIDLARKKIESKING